MVTCTNVKIDSNTTGLRFAEEECPKVLPASPTWYPLEPNSYSNFGGELTTAARNPINETRQRKKGTPVGINAAGGFNTDFTQTNLQRVMQGFMFADTRVKADYIVEAEVGDIDVVAGVDEFPQLVSTILDFTTMQLIPGEWVYLGGDAASSRFVEDENNGFKRIRSITANVLTFDKSVAPMVDEDGTSVALTFYLGSVLKNEATRALIKRRTYQLERTLGSLDDLDPPQSEYLTGAVPNELSINLAVEDKVTADLGFVAMDSEQHTQAMGLKLGTRPDQVETDMFNTSSDIARIKLARVVGDSATPLPMFTFVQQGTLTINNGITPLKGIGVFGAIDASAGNFAVGGSLTAYFSDIEAVQAVRNNEDITMDMIMVKDGAGVVFDLPLVSLGDGRPNVTIDEPITLPLTMEAATAAKLGSDFNYTAMWVFFDVLPDRARSNI